MAQSTNSVVLSGGLTRDPDLRSLPSGNSVCSMRLAFTTRRKNGDAWEDKSNYIDVTVWGRHGENCAQYLSKGSRCTVQGRLEWREWEDKEGNKRQTIEVVAENVEFGSSPTDGGGSRQGPAPDEGSFTRQHPDDGFSREAAAEAHQAAEAAKAAGPDDDIPF